MTVRASVIYIDEDFSPTLGGSARLYVLHKLFSPAVSLYKRTKWIVSFCSYLRSKQKVVPKLILKNILDKQTIIFVRFVIYF